VRVPTYATSAEMFHGRRCSNATFHCWMIPRSTLSGSGVRVKTPTGSCTRPVLRSGIVKLGMPCARVVDQP
jgi:hypothetical protein